MKTIALTRAEWSVAIRCGIARAHESNVSRRTPGWSFDDDLQVFEHHVNAASAELAWSKLINVEYQPTLNMFRGQGADVVGKDGKKWEVRFSNAARWLKVLPSDPDDYWVVALIRHPSLPRSAVAFVSAFNVVGFINAGDAKREEWWADPGNRNRPCYVVPYKALTLV